MRNEVSQALEIQCALSEAFSYTYANSMLCTCNSAWFSPARFTKIVRSTHILHHEKVKV